MKILTCIKQVPDLETIAVPADAPCDRSSFEHKPQRMNRYDEYAVETALRMREAMPVARIDALTVGPPKAADAVKRAMGMGVDHGIRIDLPLEAMDSPYATAVLIAGYAAGKQYDLILCGVMSEDLMQAQVGIILAALLDMPYVTSVVEVATEIENGDLTVVREADGGRREIMRLCLPALLTIQTGAHAPRYPSLSNLLRANRMLIETLTVDRKDWPAARLRNVNFVIPPKTRQGAILNGGAKEKAQQLAGILRAKGFLGAGR